MDIISGTKVVNYDYTDGQDSTDFRSQDQVYDKK